MAWFDPATSYAGGGLDRETGQNIPAALWQRLLDCLTVLGGTTGRRPTVRREWAKGTDIASAATIAIPTDGNYFDVTGTTGITGITAITSGLVMLQFDGALTVTDGSNLKLDGDFVTVAGSHLVLFCDGTNYWEVARTHTASAAGGVVRWQNSASYGQKIQKGTSSLAFSSQTTKSVAVSFTSTFGSTPVVTASATSAAIVCICCPTTISTTGFTFNAYVADVLANGTGGTASTGTETGQWTAMG